MPRPLISTLWLCAGLLTLGPNGCTDEDRILEPPPRTGLACIGDADCPGEECVCGEYCRCRDCSVSSSVGSFEPANQRRPSSDPNLGDMDGDGEPDLEEIGDPCNPKDCDGDGAIDAIEGAFNDADGDGVPDEFDAVDTEPFCPDGRTAVSGREISPGCLAYECPSEDDSTCDGKDDDLDGARDEDWVPDETCGVGFCAAENSCVDGRLMDCEPGPPDPAGDSSCDGIDQDCDGQADEDFVPAPCGVGACAARLACTDGREVCPEIDPPADDDTECDGIDSDCDGEVDEDFVGATCGAGGCMAEATCAEGQIRCRPGVSREEFCNTLDDDCDGEVDEDFNLGEECIVDEGPCERAGVLVCGGRRLSICSEPSPSVQVGEVMVDRFEASRPDAALDDPGEAEGRACSQPNVLPWSDITREDAAGVCEASGRRLCTTEEWLAACAVREDEGLEGMLDGLWEWVSDGDVHGDVHAYGGPGPDGGDGPTCLDGLLDLDPGLPSLDIGFRCCQDL